MGTPLIAISPFPVPHFKHQTRTIGNHLTSRGSFSAGHGYPYTVGIQGSHSDHGNTWGWIFLLKAVASPQYQLGIDDIGYPGTPPLSGKYPGAIALLSGQDNRCSPLSGLNPDRCYLSYGSHYWLGHHECCGASAN